MHMKVICGEINHGWTCGEINHSSTRGGWVSALIYNMIRKSGKDIEELKKDGELVLDHPDERALAVQLLKFSEVVEEACSNLLPSVLCEYFSNVADCYSKVYNNCKVHGSPQETSRLLLNEATAVVLRKGLELLGITPLYKL